ncbi:hypothetical protein KEM52_001387 [Ascosphaera acerosa]|nr:hypothetical protein KEM52_001387 [Ascosphaera acerosa]
MLAFEAGVRAGADALECDAHLTRDGVVVLNHDKTVKRCHGVDRRVRDCDWAFVASLSSLAPPHVGIPRLADLLAWLAVPEREHVWLYLELKLHDDTSDLVRAIAGVLASVAATPARPWDTRVVLGIWTATYLGPIQSHLPTYPVSLLTPSLTYASCFLSVPQVAGFSVNFLLLYSSAGRRFLARARAAGKAVFAWTVNKPRTMDFAVRSHLDGMVTDEVGLALRIRAEWEKRCASLEGGEGAGDGARQTGQPVQVERLPLRYRLLIGVFVRVTNLLGRLVAWRHRAVLRRHQVLETEGVPANAERVPLARGLPDGTM